MTCFLNSFGFKLNKMISSKFYCKKIWRLARSSAGNWKWSPFRLSRSSIGNEQVLVLTRVRPVVVQQLTAVILIVVVCWRMIANGSIVRVERPQRCCVLEGYFSWIQVGAYELIGRLENRPWWELRRVMVGCKVVRRGVRGQSPSCRRVMRRLLVHLLLHGTLFDVVGELSWRHSGTEIQKSVDGVLEKIVFDRKLVIN